MSLVYFLILIGVLVFVHELGHFVVAKACGVKVLRFSIGFGPALATIRRGETEYVIAALPLGGFVSMLGHDPSEEVPPEDVHRAYFSRPLYQRFAIALAGPAMNLVFPVVIYFAYFFFGFADLPPAMVGSVFANTPAARAGLQPGDEIMLVDGEPIADWTDLQKLVSESPGRPLAMKVRRGTTEHEFVVEPESQAVPGRFGQQKKIGRIGVGSYFLGSQVGLLSPHGPAARAGLETWDRVVAIDGVGVDRWHELGRRLEDAAGSTVRLAILRDAPVTSEVVGVHTALPIEVSLTVPPSGGLRALGMYPAELFALSVEEGSPAHAAGMRAKDMLVAVNGQLCPTWDACISLMAQQPEREHAVSFVKAREPEAGIQVAPVTLEIRSRIGEYKEEQRIPTFGARNRSLVVFPDRIPNPDRLGYAAVHSVRKNVEMISLTVYGFMLLLKGQISSRALGGPIMIYNIAGKAARRGWDDYLSVMALISINLGIINLFPIPMLDGGHLLFVLIEAVKRKPISLRSRAIATYVGLSMLIFLMLFAFKNDLERYWDDFTAVLY